MTNHCNYCGKDFNDCFCDIANAVLDEHYELLEDLAEVEAQEKGDRRCNECYFFVCKCKKRKGNRPND